MLRQAALVFLWWHTDPGCFAHIPCTTTMPKKNKAQNVGAHLGHCKLYLKCAINEQDVINELVTWNKIVAYRPNPKEGEHYSPTPYKIRYKSCRLPHGKWFVVAITDSEAGYRRHGIRHFYVTQEDSVKDLPGIEDLQVECDEILQYARTYVIGDALTCRPPPEAEQTQAKKMKNPDGSYPPLHKWSLKDAQKQYKVVLKDRLSYEPIPQHSKVTAFPKPPPSLAQPSSLTAFPKPPPSLAQPSSLTAFPKSQPLNPGPFSVPKETHTAPAQERGDAQPSQTSQNLTLKEDTDSKDLPNSGLMDEAPELPALSDHKDTILPVPDAPATMPQDVASNPKEVLQEVAQMIGTLANVANPSGDCYVLEEVVATINAVPRSAPSTPRDEHTNLGGSEPFKCFGRDDNGEFFVLPEWEKARSLEKTDLH